MAKKLFPFKEVNSKWNIGLQGGYINFDETGSGMCGVSFTLKGIHVDLGGLGPGHKHDVNVGKWTSKVAYSIHIGYQIPIVNAFRIIPLIGYASTGKGYTDGYNYEISYGGTVTNDSSMTFDNQGFDYGAKFVINIKKFNINIAATRYVYYGGVALEF